MMLNIRSLGLRSYNSIWMEMKEFTSARNINSIDELWVLEHHSVYTQGQAGKERHILHASKIPIIHSDRGGQITYHGPGQSIAYLLIDIRRRNISIRNFVCQLEQILINLLKYFKITAQTHSGAPGVYVAEKKIASIGLRVKNGCTYHGIALNIAMDLTPFDNINPCGYEKLEMTQMKNFIPNISVDEVNKRLKLEFLTIFG